MKLVLTGFTLSWETIMKDLSLNAEVGSINLIFYPVWISKCVSTNYALQISHLNKSISII